MKKGFTQAFGDAIAKHRKIILIIATLLLIPSLYGAVSTKINYDILTYLPKDSESVKGQEILDREFGGASTGMLVIENMTNKDVVKTKEKIKTVKGVEDVIWVDDLVDISVPSTMLPEDVQSLLFRENSTLLIVKFDEGNASPLTHEAIDDIRSLLDEHSFLSGMSALLKDTKELADAQTPIYVGLAVLLATLVLAMTLESTVIPFIILLSIGYAIAYNFGTNVIFGQISYITKSLAAVLQLGVTLDYSIFLLHRYEEELRKNSNKEQAMGSAIASTASSIVGSSLTTVAGFLAIGAMNLTIGKDIGFVMAKGVVLGVLSVLTVLPSLILIFDGPIHKWRHRTILPEFDHLSKLVTRHAKVFVLIGVLLFVPAYFGQSNNDVYYNLDESLPKDMASMVALTKLKDDYNMQTTHFAVIPKTVPDFEITRMIKEIESLDGIENVISYQKYVGPTVPESFLPEKVVSIFEKGDYKRLIINSSFKSATDEENQQIEAISSIMKQYDDDALLTGEGVLTKDLIDIADEDFARVNALSFAAVFIIIALVFMSVSIPVLLIAAIMLAIFINMSVPFYMGTSIPFIAGIVIGSIQLGATVDYAILLTTRFKEECGNGLEKHEAMEIAVKESAKSISTSGLAFFGSTVGVAIISEMELVSSLSGMIARGAIISTLVILFILPGILLGCEGIISKTTRGWKKSNKGDVITNED